MGRGGGASEGGGSEDSDGGGDRKDVVGGDRKDDGGGNKPVDVGGGGCMDDGGGKPETAAPGRDAGEFKKTLLTQLFFGMHQGQRRNVGMMKCIRM